MKLTIQTAEPSLRKVGEAYELALPYDGHHVQLQVGNVSIAFDGRNQHQHICAADATRDSDCSGYLLQFGAYEDCPVRLDGDDCPKCETVAETLLFALAADLGYIISTPAPQPASKVTITQVFDDVRSWIGSAYLVGSPLLMANYGKLSKLRAAGHSPEDILQAYKGATAGNFPARTKWGTFRQLLEVDTPPALTADVCFDAALRWATKAYDPDLSAKAIERVAIYRDMMDKSNTLTTEYIVEIFQYADYQASSRDKFRHFIQNCEWYFGPVTHEEMQFGGSVQW